MDGKSGQGRQGELGNRWKCGAAWGCTQLSGRLQRQCLLRSTGGGSIWGQVDRWCSPHSKRARPVPRPAPAHLSQHRARHCCSLLLRLLLGLVMHLSKHLSRTVCVRRPRVGRGLSQGIDLCSPARITAGALAAQLLAGPRTPRGPATQPAAAHLVELLQEGHLHLVLHLQRQRARVGRDGGQKA